MFLRMYSCKQEIDSKLLDEKSNQPHGNSKEHCQVLQSQKVLEKNNHKTKYVSVSIYVTHFSFIQLKKE